MYILLKKNLKQGDCCEYEISRIIAVTRSIDAVIRRHKMQYIDGSKALSLSEPSKANDVIKFPAAVYSARFLFNELKLNGHYVDSCRR